MRHDRLLPTPDDTAELGRRLGKLLFPGAVVALVGPLGAGKTTLVRATAAALGADPRSVTSPTFALVHEYPGRVPVYHFDAYRLTDVQAFLDLGVEEYFAGDGVCLVEWADRVAAALPGEHLRVTLGVEGEGRRAVVESLGRRYDAVVTELNVKPF
jgi:tRNA threonylcarbamoyladenosine biosynthesis protein TsaE